MEFYFIFFPLSVIGVDAVTIQGRMFLLPNVTVGILLEAEGHSPSHFIPSVDLSSKQQEEAFVLELQVCITTPCLNALRD